MAGRSTVRLQHQILSTMVAGPASKADMLKSVGHSLFGPTKHLDQILYSLRASGIVQPVKGKKGWWELVDGLTVCPTCCGKGIVKSK